MKIHHIAVVVADLDQALPFWRDALGLAEIERHRVASENVEVAFLRPPEDHSTIELIEPLAEDTALARQLQRPGSRLHHLCLQVNDLDERLARLRAAGIALINEEPRELADGTRYAFIHPRSTGGVLLELYEVPV